MRRSIQIPTLTRKKTAFVNEDTLFTVMTRFNVNRNDPRMDQHLRSWESYTHWLASRIEVFWTYCFPSLTQQTILPHAWFILFDDRITRQITKMLDALLEHDWIVPLILGDDWGTEKTVQAREVAQRRFGDRGFSKVCTVRLDSDDALNTRYMAWIDHAIAVLRREWDTDDPRTINFPYGALRLGDHYYVEHQVRQYFGIFEPIAVMQTPYRRGHRQIGDVTDVYDVFTAQPMFLYNTHETNISRIGGTRPSSRQPFGDVPGLLRQFGLEHLAADEIGEPHGGTP